MANKSPFQLLEINVISAQDLEVVSKVRKMKTYATARVTGRKLTSSVDTEGHNNPTWNDKFVFKVDEEFLRRDTSAVMIEIFCENWIRDKIVGSVRVLVGNLIPPPNKAFYGNNGMRFVALQVRRPSGRPQGILNIGVALLDGSMRSMPLYRQLSASAVGYRDLMYEDHQQHNQNSNNHDDDKEKSMSPPVVKPILLRSKSERSERVSFENASVANSSIVAIAHKRTPALERDSSILSISDVGNPFMKKTTKASSVISGFELREKPKKHKGKKGKAGSVLSDSVYSKDSVASRYLKHEKKPKEEVASRHLKHEKKPEEEIVNHVEKKEVAVPVPAPVPVPVSPASVSTSPASVPVAPKVMNEATVEKVEPPQPIVKEKPTKETGVSAQKFIPYEYPTPKVNQKYVLRPPKKPTSSIWSDSEVGPSPSEVAAHMAEKRYPLDDGQSSVLDGWSYDESVEGLRSKLDRWRTELPPIYDRGYSRGGYSSSYQSSVQRPRRRSEAGEPGLFSCFGNIFGYECQCVCGQPPAKKYNKYNQKSRRSSSFGSRSRSFL